MRVALPCAANHRSVSDSGGAAAIGMSGMRKPQAPAAPLQPMPRVKVFRLNDEQGWDDCGTGHVTFDYLEGSMEKIVLAVIDTTNDEAILLHLITSDDIYRKQGETFISWCDPEAGMELSLSFQDPAGGTICEVQRTQRLGI